MNIRVFPATSSDLPSNKLITEYNLISIVNRLTDKNSFVVNYSTSPNTKNISFNIQGYYFELTLTGDDEIYGSENLYAGIKIEDNSGSNEGNPSYNILNAGDLNYGLILKSSPFENTEGVTYSLQLLSGNQVPPDSKVKFTTNSFSRSITIDDGDLDT